MEIEPNGTVVESCPKCTTRLPKSTPVEAPPKGTERHDTAKGESTRAQPLDPVATAFPAADLPEDVTPELLVLARQLMALSARS